ncbi:DUF757 domain-containing protein [Rutstroemia sp. NJR-2017a BBW]|nr:DUF757 domain-containing protein [Rutstroemia sp. NJR-2017a BBW]
MSEAPVPSNFNPEEADNFEDTSLRANVFATPRAEHTDFEKIEKQFANIHPSSATSLLTPQPVVQHMSTYWAILEKVRGSALRLTKIDDEIYDHLKKDFPEFDPAATINEDEMKSKTGKERWRTFMMQYENRVDDFNFGTMLRSNPKWEYGQDETIFGMYCALRVRMGRG